MKKLVDGKMKLLMDTYDFSKIVIKESQKNNVKVIKDVNHWRLIGDVQFMQLHTKSNVEIKELYSSYDLAYGDVLITGLGFGILALWVANKPEVTSVTVIENSQDVVDIFLENNPIPDNVTIIVADANAYTTTTHYDCLLLDHYKDGTPQDQVNYEKLNQIAKNIPHDLLWFWSMEYKYLTTCYGLKFADFYLLPVDFSGIDLNEKWQEWLDFLSIPTIPSPTTDKVKDYIEHYFNRK
jgi:hypothetical protein